MAGDYRLHGTATLETLAEVHDLFERISEPVSTQDLMLFETALVEVIGNLVKHGRPPGEVPFYLRIEISDEALLAELDDWSDGEMPYLHAEMPAAAEESGRGLPLVQAVLDEFSVAGAADRHLWRLRRNRA